MLNMQTKRRKQTNRRRRRRRNPCLIVSGGLDEMASRTLLFLVLERIHLVDAWTVVGWVATESNVERLQELVHTSQQSLGSEVSKRQRWQLTVGQRPLHLVYHRRR
jgi:hypothetical protein